MAWHPDFTEAPAEPSLDPFRRAVGRLVLEGKAVGHVATEVSQMAEKDGGWLWWRSWRVYEFLSLAVTRLEGDSPLPDWDDPWWFPREASNARWIAELTEGKFDYPDARTDSELDVSYKVEWLTGDELESAWREFGPERTWTPTTIRR
jgi:hypothetical protein